MSVKTLSFSRKMSALPRLPSIRELIKLYGLTAKSQLSQNFILDKNITGRLWICLRILLLALTCLFFCRQNCKNCTYYRSNTTRSRSWSWPWATVSINFGCWCQQSDRSRKRWPIYTYTSCNATNNNCTDLTLTHIVAIVRSFRKEIWCHSRQYAYDQPPRHHQQGSNDTCGPLATFTHYG